MDGSSTSHNLELHITRPSVVIQWWGRTPCFYVSPPILNEPILLFWVDPVKVDGFGICGVNIADIGAIKGGAMGGQKGYRRGAPEGTRPSETHSVCGLRWREIIFWR